jgi:hypothetical protein
VSPFATTRSAPKCITLQYTYMSYVNRYAMSESQKYAVVAVIILQHDLTEQQYTLHSACDGI